MRYLGLSKKKKYWYVVFVMTILLMVGINDAKTNASPKKQNLVDCCDEDLDDYRMLS